MKVSVIRGSLKSIISVLDVSVHSLRMELVCVLLIHSHHKLMTTFDHVKQLKKFLWLSVTELL